MTPNDINGAPLRVRNAGMIVWKGRLPGATTLGLRGSRLKPLPRFCSETPHPGTTTPEPKPM